MKIDELIDRLDAIAEIMKDLDNAVTSDLMEAIDEAKRIVIKKNNEKEIQREITLEQLRKNHDKANDDLVKVNAAFDNFFDNFILQLMRESKRNKDDKFGK